MVVLTQVLPAPHALPKSVATPPAAPSAGDDDDEQEQERHH
jgi:hypothetical protein